MTSKLLVSAVALTFSCTLCVGANAQLHRVTPQARQQSYSDYYSKNATKYRRPSASAAKYTVDRIYYKSPSVSPYMSLLRGAGGGYTSNYYEYVRPEENRRQRSFQQEIKGAGRGTAGTRRASTIAPRSFGAVPAGRPAHQGVVNSNYYKHFYGGSRK